MPLCSNNRSKGLLHLGITFRHFPVDEFTKKSWIVRIRRDAGKNVQVSDRVIRLQDEQALVLQVSYTSFDRLVLILEPSCYFTALLMYSVFIVRNAERTATRNGTGNSTQTSVKCFTVYCREYCFVCLHMGKVFRLSW